MSDSGFDDVTTVISRAADGAGLPRAGLADDALRVGRRRLRTRRITAAAGCVAALAVGGVALQAFPTTPDRSDITGPALAASASSQPRECGPAPKPARAGQRRFELEAAFPSQARAGSTLRADLTLKTLSGTPTKARTGTGGHIILARDGAAVTEPIARADARLVDLVPGGTIKFPTFAYLAQCRAPHGGVEPLPPGNYDVYVIVGLDLLDANGRITSHTSAATGPLPFRVS